MIWVDAMAGCIVEREKLRDPGGRTGRILSLVKSGNWERDEGCLTSRVMTSVLG